MSVEIVGGFGLILIGGFFLLYFIAVGMNTLSDITNSPVTRAHLEQDLNRIAKEAGIDPLTPAERNQEKLENDLTYVEAMKSNAGENAWIEERSDGGYYCVKYSVVAPSGKVFETGYREHHIGELYPWLTDKMPEWMKEAILNGEVILPDAEPSEQDQPRKPLYKRLQG